ncbi:hypothetical protein AGDE_05104 [Angomonas deanei]|uniref:META domain containing protein, putative n=1 Tax=Angomonas deanei TaxID=59799 RepID=A0A7G2CBE7_9TRYP|nr:hypothetical protein AGDE_05104 [Angomonas deanei]CAD2216264.1 META domain containing protein, putative [Angomonas deanei]|eukprot:EPY38825.1 hypothetical protein AGDE_05104 [Angomonas deanei]
MPSTKDIAGSYVIHSFDGSKVDVKVTLTSESATTLRFHAKVANVMNGTLTLENGVLKGMLISTMMMGPPELMKVESFFSGFNDGLKVKVDGSNVVLSNDKASLVLTKA